MILRRGKLQYIKEKEKFGEIFKQYFAAAPCITAKYPPPMKKNKNSPPREHPLRQITWEILTVAFSSALFGISMNSFLVSKNIIIGGASGIATLAMHFTKIPAGTVMLAVNVPLLILNAREKGARSMLKSVVGTVASSVAVDIFSFVPPLAEDMLTCAVAGGGGMGIGAGLMFLRGYTTGGSDLCAFTLMKRAPHLSAGRLILIIDGVIITASALLLRDMSLLIYCLASSAAYSIAIDRIIDGSVVCRSILVISDRYSEIAGEISEKLDRGVTLLCGEGWYTGEKKKIILCVVRRREEYALRSIVTGVDPHAFIILSSGTEAIGSGFEKESG